MLGIDLRQLVLHLQFAFDGRKFTTLAEQRADYGQQPDNNPE